MEPREKYGRLVGRWERQTHQYSDGYNYCIGKIVVGSAAYMSTTRDDPKKYGVTILLPGIRPPDNRYTNVEDAKARLERAVATWFRWLDEGAEA